MLSVNAQVPSVLKTRVVTLERVAVEPVNAYMDTVLIIIVTTVAITIVIVASLVIVWTIWIVIQVVHPVVRQKQVTITVRPAENIAKIRVLMTVM
jgi:hypothetical protein